MEDGDGCVNVCILEKESAFILLHVLSWLIW